MRKLITIILLLGSLPVFAQTGQGWKPNNTKLNQRDSSYYHKDVNFNSTVRINENALRIGLVTVTANGTELNILDGALVNTTELNRLVGVTSGVQGQLNAKINSADTTGKSPGNYMPRISTAKLVSDSLDKVRAGATLAVSLPDTTGNYVGNYMPRASTAKLVGDSLDKARAEATIAIALPDSGVYNGGYMSKFDGMEYTEGYDNYIMYKKFNLGVKGESFGCSINDASGTTVKLTAGSAYYSPVVIKEAGVITGVKFLSMATGVKFSTTGFNGCALYKFRNDSLIQVAITASDTTKWKSGSANVITFPFVTPYTVDKRDVYYVGVMATMQAGSTDPGILGSGTMYGMRFGDFVVYRTGQTQLATNVPRASLTPNTTIRWFVLY